MRGFLTSTERKYSLTLVIVTIMCLLFIPAYMVWDLSNTLGTLALRVTDMELKHAEDRQMLKMLNVRVKALSDETKWVREQEPVSRAYTRTSTEYFTITAYTLYPSECGKPVGSPGYGVTASGRKLTEADAYKVVAVDNRYIKFGTRMIIHAPQGDLHVIAADTGGDIVGNRLDLFVSEADRGKAFAWGTKWLKVTVLQ